MNEFRILYRRLFFFLFLPEGIRKQILPDEKLTFIQFLVIKTMSLTLLKNVLRCEVIGN